MPRKELSPPDENRKRAERLNGGNAENSAEKSKSPIKGSGSPDRQTGSRQVSDFEISPITGEIESPFTPPGGSPASAEPMLAESPLRPGSGSPDRQIGSRQASDLEVSQVTDATELVISPFKGAIKTSISPPGGSPLAPSPLRPGSGSPDRQTGSRQVSDLEVSPIVGAIKTSISPPGGSPLTVSPLRPSAKQYAMSLVAARTYTERGLREKMRIRGYGCDETDEAVEYLKGFGYINDLRIAQNAAEKLAEKGNGRRKIFAYLASRGIPRDVIGEIDLSEYDFKEICLRAAEKLEAKGKRRDQIMRSLASSGFSSSEITHALERLGYED